MERLFAVAEYFLAKESMPQNKLQKICYYAYAWTLALLNNDVSNLQYKLFPNRIEAWVHGPVIPDLWQRYRDYGWGNIPQIYAESVFSFTEEEVEILDQVWHVYGKYSSGDLEMFLHQETPWINARKGIPYYQPSNNLIEEEDIYRFFRKQINID